jgi:uncharacterized protein YcbK (DUF882 family)
MLGAFGLQFANAIGDTRTLSLHHIHTNEDITVTFKRNGKFDDAELKRLNWFLRDWRRDEQVTMDPQLIDLLWEVHREVGAKGPIHVICGYRAPETNAMLRSRSNGVAMFSQHMSGNAIDFSIPGVAIEDVRVAALRLQGGGVGYYPTSGSRFVHMDVANVRHWPRMSREELVKVFPDQRTVHIPADGHPLAGYALALADLERGMKHAPQQQRPTLLAKLSGVHDDEEISTGSTQQLPPMPMARPSNLITAALNKAPPQPQPAKPAVVTVAAKADTTPPPAVNAAIQADVPPMPVRRPQVAVAGISPSSIFLPWPTANQVDRVSPEVALAYAAVAKPEPTAPTTLSNVQRPVLPSEPKRQSPPGLDRSAVSMPMTASVRADNPWLRAVVLAPSIYTFMTSSQLNPIDSRQFGPLMAKPTSALVMSFSSDPYGGMNSTAFSGKAVQFLATVSFGMRTAALH